jgi:hypothetical protein
LFEQDCFSRVEGVSRHQAENAFPVWPDLPLTIELKARETTGIPVNPNPLSGGGQLKAIRRQFDRNIGDHKFHIGQVQNRVKLVVRCIREFIDGFWGQ